MFRNTRSQHGHSQRSRNTRSRNEEVITPVAALLNYSFWLLSRRDYSEKELRKKLGERWKKLENLLDNPEKRISRDAQGGISSDAQGGISHIESVITKIKELGYINDERFAKHFLHSRTEINPRGKFLLRFELKKKGVSEKTFEKLWEEGGYNEEALAKRFMERKKSLLMRLPSAKRRKKIISLLSSRGFSGETIAELLQKIKIEKIKIEI